MRSVATRRLIGAACGFLTLTGSQAAFAMDKYIDLEPPQTKSGLGYGYNSISREFVLRSCVQFAPGVTEGGSGASGDDFKFSSIVSNAQLADEMDLSVATKFSASMGVASVNSSAKVDFFRSVKTNFLTHTILASYNNVEPMKYIAGGRPRASARTCGRSPGARETRCYPPVSTCRRGLGTICL